MKDEMRKPTLFFINSPILTNYGAFSHQEITKEEVVELLKGAYVSAIGHLATANHLSEILGTTIPYNRMKIKMREGDRAIVFRLIERCKEGDYLSERRLRDSAFSFSLLTLEKEFVERERNFLTI